MKTSLLTSGIWASLTSAAKNARKPAYVAVAYFGKGASRLLPLPAGSRLVVDASDGAVKSGQTCPTDLKVMQDRGVVIYSAQNLHAKIYVFENVALIGSANASHNAAETLIEAMVQISDGSVIRSARQFVRGLCLDELTPKTIDRLHIMYRSPRFLGKLPHKHSTNRKIRPVIRRLLLAQSERGTFPPEAATAENEGLQTAKSKQKHKRSYVLDHFWWTGLKCPYRVGDKIVEVMEQTSNRYLIAPPADVIHLRKWKSKNRRLTFVYFEHPDIRRISLEKLARRIGYGAKKKLRRAGLIRNQIFAEKLFAAFGA